MYFASKLLTLGRARELSTEAAEYLGQVVRDTGEETKHRVAAARCLVAHGEWQEDRHSPMLAFLRMFPTPEAAWRWLAENREKMTAMLEARPPAVDEPNGA